MSIKLKHLTSLRRRLPDQAYLPNTKSLGSPHGVPQVWGLRFGQRGTFPVFTGRTAAELNTEAGVTPQQLSAMVAGSKLGWDHPTADPEHPDHKGPA